MKNGILISLEGPEGAESRVLCSLLPFAKLAVALVLLRRGSRAASRLEAIREVILETQSRYGQGCQNRAWLHIS